MIIHNNAIHLTTDLQQVGSVSYWIRKQVWKKQNK